MSQCELFSLNHPPVIQHNIFLLTNYYTKHQYRYYKSIINTHFTLAQPIDTRFIPLPTIIPPTHVSISQCNPNKDVITIYKATSRHFITIPTTRLKWLWKQYNNAIYSTHGSVPLPQSFETKLGWLYQRYKYRFPNKDPLNHHNILYQLAFLTPKGP